MSTVLRSLQVLPAVWHDIHPENRRSVQTIVQAANYFSETLEKCRYSPMVYSRSEQGKAHLVEFPDKRRRPSLLLMRFTAG